MENADDFVFNTNFRAAHLRAGQRVKKATEGVKQYAKFVEKLCTLHSDVKLELKVWHPTKSYSSSSSLYTCFDNSLLYSILMI
jgi:hypothetical protein